MSARPTTQPTSWGLYGAKPALQRRLVTMADFLAARRVDPDHITFAAVSCGLVAAAIWPLAAQSAQLWLLWTIPVLAAMRIVLNALDGMVAARRGIGRPWGGYLNDLGDRVADCLFLSGLFWVPGLDVRLAAAALVAVVLASYAGVLTSAHGGARHFGGVMAKADRMLWLSLASGLAAATADWTALRWLPVLILLGSIVTIVQRGRDARATL